MNYTGLIPPNNKRVEMHTSNKINKRIAQRTEENIKEFFSFCTRNTGLVSTATFNKKNWHQNPRRNSN